MIQQLSLPHSAALYSGVPGTAGKLDTKLKDIGYPLLALQQGAKKLAVKVQYFRFYLLVQKMHLEGHFNMTQSSVLISLLYKISKELLFLLQNLGFNLFKETYHRGSGRCRQTLRFLCKSKSQYLGSCFLKSNNVDLMSFCKHILKKPID